MSRSFSPVTCSNVDSEFGPWMPKMKRSGLTPVTSAAQHALGSDPAVLVELHVVLDLADLEPGQASHPQPAEELQGPRPADGHLVQRCPVPEVAGLDVREALVGPVRVLQRQQDLREA